MTNKNILKLIQALAFFCISAHSALAVQNVVFVNGIRNTILDALKSKRKLVDVLQESANHAGVDHRDFAVKLVYNPIGFAAVDGPDSLNEDLRELFVLKTSEEVYELDFAALTMPFNAAETIDAATASRVKKFATSLLPREAALIPPVNNALPLDGLNMLEAKGLITQANLGGTRAAISAILREISQGSRTVIVAHSQGNLLANLAYASLATNIGSDVAKTVRIVNVANTSKFAVNSLDLTHATDDALELLKNIPRGTGWTRTTPGCVTNSTCDFANALVPFSGVTLSTLDFPYHSFEGIYLSDKLLPNVIISNGVAFTQGAIRFRDRFEDLMYAASASLDKATITPNGGSVDVGATLTLELLNDDTKPMAPAPASSWSIDKPAIASVSPGLNCKAGPLSCAIVSGLSAGTTSVAFKNAATGEIRSVPVIVNAKPKADDFQFELTDVGGITGAKKYSCSPYVGLFGQSLGGTIDQCFDNTNIRIRCVGVGCRGGRFMASINGGELAINQHPVGPWAQLGVTCIGYNVAFVSPFHQSETDAYAPGSIYWFDIGRGDWVKPAPILDNISAGPILSNVFYMNDALVYRPFYGDCVSYQLKATNIRFNIIDLTDGTYRTLSISSVTP